jgi:hypothetical protein
MTLNIELNDGPTILQLDFSTLCVPPDHSRPREQVNADQTE